MMRVEDRVGIVISKVVGGGEWDGWLSRFGSIELWVEDGDVGVGIASDGRSSVNSAIDPLRLTFMLYL